MNEAVVYRLRGIAEGLKIHLSFRQILPGGSLEVFVSFLSIDRYDQPIPMDDAETI
jgi:hypothetical protein